MATMTEPPSIFFFSFFLTQHFREMEAMKLKFFVALMVVLMAISSVQKAAAATDAPAPSPTSDAAIFVPTFFASLVALAFGLVF
nr:arabinogalactan peptide 14 [Quercus suber]